MRSTFMGLEASKRGLFTQQSALYTTGHNISNANTQGYTRQRVNMEATEGFPGTGLNSPKTAGHIGTGVQAHSVQRMRDEFTDRQYRQETNKLGYWESKTKSISQMEDILSEPSEFGLNQAFNDLWKSIQDISTNPEDAAARKVMLAKAQALADSFNYNTTQLKTIQSNIGNEINAATTQINSILKQIADINKQVQAVEPNGYMPNDLYDARDRLVDELNDYMPVTVERVKSGGNSLDIAEGSYTIKFKGVADSRELVNGQNFVQLKSVGPEPDHEEITGDNIHVPFASMMITALNNSAQHENNEKSNTTIFLYPGLDYTEFEASKGRLVALADAYGYTTDPTGTDPVVHGIYPEMMQNLDKLVESFVTAFNKVHSEGHSLDGTDITNIPFFIGDSASTISVNEDYLKNPSLIAASSGEGEEGNGKWAIELSNLQFVALSGQNQTFLGKPIDLDGADLGGATFQSFYKSLIGQLGVDGQEAIRLEYNSTTLRLQVDNNRSSMNSVSLDEEMTNMITFQQAYNANARMITVIDETLDKIINGMGRVGL